MGAVDLEREVHHLRLQLAKAEMKAAANYKLITIVVAAATVWIWAMLSSALEAGEDPGVHMLLAFPLPLLGVLWWAARRHHERLESRLNKAAKEAQDAGFSVELTEDFVHIARSKRALHPD